MALLVLAAAPAAAGAEPSAAVKVQSSRFGPILFDGRGFVLYAFTRDPRRVSKCAGACAAAWPPYRARGAGQDVFEFGGRWLVVRGTGALVR